MKLKYSTFTDKGVDRIAFSREELLAMSNSIGYEEHMKPVKQFIEHLEAKLLEHS